MFMSLVLTAGLAWLGQMMARALWALLFGGPEAAKWLRDPNVRERRNAEYWFAVVAISVVLTLVVAGLIWEVAALAGVRSPANPRIIAFGFSLLAAVGAYAMAWCIWTGIATGAFPDRYGGSGSRRRGQPISFWLSVVLCMAVFLLLVGLIGACWGFIFGLWG
jgi:hypothetical protein